MDEITWCDVCKGSKAKNYCKTEQRNICSDCIGFCHRFAHNWIEGKLKDEVTMEEGEASASHP